MAKIKPFKAVRPSRDKVGLVVTRSYEDYSEAEREASLSFNPFSFLHIVNPGYKFHQEVSGPQRFQLVYNRYIEFKEDQIFIQDEKPSFYIYKMVARNHEFCGIFGGASTDDYRKDVIKKHEDTLEHKEVLFKDYLKTVGFNAEPVLLTYPDNALIEKVVNRYTKTPPEYEFATKDRNIHFLWKIDNEDDVATLQQEFKNIGNLYIADGHHRSASSNLLAEELKAENAKHTGEEPYNYFMSYLIPESNLKIYEFNRLVKDLNGLSKEAFLIHLDKYFKIENNSQEAIKPSKKHQFTMYLDGDFYSLHLRKTVYQFTNSLSELDAQILYKTVLEPILNISDLRNDHRIAYGYGKHNIIKMKDLVDDGIYEVGFSLLPVTIKEMKKIADDGLQMPPKSTYIEPKMRSGLTIYEF
ncbi:DUF1015 domain-containing protein [Zhouia sp. PK063]|uniref:DUF1015 domain-containing protein n=1 Tax=Zhouia sp. PK063 TaxID=3373602 RepID=UPI0037BACA4D